MVLEFLKQLLDQYGLQIFSALFVLIICLVVIIIADYFFKRLAKRLTPTKRARTLMQVTINTLKVLIFIVGLLICLAIFKINITPILASAGILGLAVGFGAQVLVKDIISGIFFIFENQFNAGDLVRIDTIEGTVEKVGLRTMAVRDIESGALHIIPNSSISRLSNFSDRYINAVVTISLPASNNLQKVTDIATKVGSDLIVEEEYKDSILDDPKLHILESLSDNRMTFTVIFKCHPGKQEKVARRYRFLLKQAFEQAKILFV